MMIPNPDDNMRATDAERAQAEVHLREACVDGRLTLAEFSTRMDTVLIARTRGQLKAITADLGATPAAPARAPIATRIRAILGEKLRSGRWRAEGAVEITAVMGNCQIDLRDAEIIGDEVLLNLRALMSEVKICVPRGVQVVMEETAGMSSSKDVRPSGTPLPEGPIVRIRGVSIMSSVEVTSEQPSRF
jgi:hypothetical protein